MDKTNPNGTILLVATVFAKKTAAYLNAVDYTCKMAVIKFRTYNIQLKRSFKQGNKKIPRQRLGNITYTYSIFQKPARLKIWNYCEFWFWRLKPSIAVIKIKSTIPAQKTSQSV